MFKEKAWNYYRNFLTWDVEKQNHALIHKPPEFWEHIGAEKALEVFHAAAKRVPAYKKFLDENNINPKNIKTFKDFQTIPIINKKNYLCKYPLSDLCWDGDLTRLNVISVSSGSTGKPFYWPRDNWQELEVDHWYKLTYRYFFQADQKHSLVVIAFAMGMYIAGPFTFASSLRAAQKGYPLAITSPGSNIHAILDVIRNLSDEFEQVILGGYPPFIKEVLDTGTAQGIDWQKKRIRLFFGGEGFSETWRDYIHDILNTKNSLTSTINMYGTADSALLGIETPTSIMFRRLLAKNSAEQLLQVKSNRLPSILTYNPLLKYFEVIDDQVLIFTSSSGIPLIRYRIGDVGGVIPYKLAQERLKTHNVSLPQTPINSQVPNWNLPLVYLFGRDDFTVQAFGANVYPENIKEGLEQKEVAKFVTGKFILETLYDKNMTPYLDLQIELAKEIKATDDLQINLRKIIISTLRKCNSEYEVIYTALGEKAEPKLTLVPYGEPQFQINIKHRWVRKTN